SNVLFVSTGDVNVALGESRAALAEAERLGGGDLAAWISEVSCNETLAGRCTRGLLERALDLGWGPDLPLFADSPRWVDGLRLLYVDRLDESRALFEAELLEAERHGEDGYYAGL